MAKKRKRQFYTQEVQWDDEELRQRIEERRRRSTVSRRRRKLITLILLTAVFSMLATMCGKDIVRLKAENRALKKQQIALEQQREELQEELKNANKQEYIREQAKKQLRLLSPGEILFTFEEEDAQEAPENADKAEEENTDKEKKDGGSDG